MRKRRFTSAGVRQIVTHGIVATTALAAVTGVVAPGTAVAAPSSAVADAGSIGTNDEQRVAAAAVVRLDPKPDVLLLSDYNFIHALWQKARDAGEELGAVRTAAEEAMASPKAEDHVRFITTGIHQAYKLDQQREKDKADVERAARLAKSQALLAVGIPSNSDLLALSDDNFIRAIMRHDAAGPEVRTAAAKALASDAPAWREFIVNGAREAHQRDMANERKELEEKNRKEAERLKERAARTSAAALFRITPSEAMLNLGDDNFIRELLRVAPDDLRNTELYAAGQKAVFSADPADWKQFIHTGAEQAYKRDDEARRKKLAEANRKLALSIQSTAENGGVNPGLVAAAKKALAGSDEDVAEFLKEDNLKRARRQSVQSAEEAKLAGWYIRQSSVDDGGVFLTPVNAKSKLSDRQDATWTVVPGLANEPGCFSFESVRKPGHYLALVDKPEPYWGAYAVPDDGSQEFRRNSTWCARRGPSGNWTAFQMVNDRRAWLRNWYGSIQPIHEDDWPNESKTHWNISPPLAP
ncbi:AbfB domain-containing protein [Streptomyces olivoreticuli]|uniref:AbfB domain-containing protein n=1 Tax=Streptomyces olivoreticuli TaxID=68246 RepID=UPI001F083073|nr:AbfB domain-containing protein [Streptomyces olivoreticuli]